MSQRAGRFLQRTEIRSGLTVLLLGLAAVFQSPTTTAAAPESSSQRSPTAAFDWQPVPGKAIDLSIDPEGEAYAVDFQGSVWHWRADGQRWGPMSGRFVRIVGAGGNRPWTIDSKGRIFRYNGLWWEKKGEGGADVAADAKGDVFVADANGSLRRWNPLRGEWSPVSAAPAAIRVALAPDGTLWILDRQGRVYFYDGREWAAPAGNIHARDLAADVDRRVWVVTRSGLVLAWQPVLSRWQRVFLPEKRLAQAVAVAPDGKPWVVLRNGDMIGATRLGPASGKGKEKEPKASVPQAGVPHPSGIHAPEQHAQQLSAPPAVAPGAVAKPVTTAPQQPVGQATGKGRGARPPYIDPALVTATGPLTFTDTRAFAGMVAIGRDGSVFALSTGGAVERWSNADQRLESFPGQLVRLAVDPSGNPWGISALGRIFRHDGTRWKQITGTASDIAIGADGTVVVASNDGGLYRLNPAGTAFVRIHGTGLVVAVDPDGHPWTIDANGYVRNCAVSPCALLPQKAISIAIGPDRSLFVVSDRNVLKRYNRSTGKFDRVDIPRYTPARVAVGPSGYPWVVTTDNRLLSTHMFPRDESRDRQVARATTGDTTGSGATATVTSTTETTGFVFSKNMSFKTVGTSLFSSDSYVYLDAGNDGKIYGYGDSSGKFGTYNTNKKSFDIESSKFTDSSYDVNRFAVASNGDIWAYTVNPTTGLFREHNNTLKEFTVSGLTAAGVAIGPDDTVYAIFGTGGTYYLYKKASTDTKFTKFDKYSVLEVGIGPGNDIWIVDRSNFVREWNGSDFVKRPSNGQQADKIAVSTNGTVYIIDPDGSLRKWNGTNKSFDKVNNTSADFLTVDSDGRPWFSSGIVVKYGKD